MHKTGAPHSYREMSRERERKQFEDWVWPLPYPMQAGGLALVQSGGMERKGMWWCVGEVQLM